MRKAARTLGRAAFRIKKNPHRTALSLFGAAVFFA